MRNTVQRAKDGSLEGIEESSHNFKLYNPPSTPATSKETEIQSNTEKRGCIQKTQDSLLEVSHLVDKWNHLRHG